MKRPGPAAAERNRPYNADVAVGLLALRLSDELAALSWLAEDLQSVTERLGSGTPLTASQSRSLQALDRLTQTLYDLSRALRHVADVAPDSRLDANALAEVLTLGDLRARLLVGQAPDDAADGTGAVSLF